jgi:hypothetical protein
MPDRLFMGNGNLPSSIARLAASLQVACYCCWVDKIVRQKLDSTTTTRGGLGHWRRTDRLRILNLWRTDNYLQA